MRTCTRPSPIRFYNFAPSGAAQDERIMRGLRQADKELPAFLLYDARGIRLAERLARIGPDVAVQRERRLLWRSGHELRHLLGTRATIVEYGSGASTTVIALLRALKRAVRYVPVDLSLWSLRFGVRRVRKALPHIDVVPVRADFRCCFPMPAAARRSDRTLVYLSSGTLATLDPASSIRLLKGASRFCGRRGGVLLAVDLQKNVSEDRHALAKAFNINALAHLNRRFGANFHLDRFAHKATFDQAHGRAELRLVSQADQTVKLDGRKIRLRCGETILTASRRQYRWPEVEALVREVGMHIERSWFDAAGSMGLAFVRPR